MPYRPRNKRILRPPFKVTGGFRFIKGTGPKLTRDFVKKLEKQSTLTDVQHDIVKRHISKCIREIKDEESNIEKMELLVTEKYMEKLENLINKPVAKAKVNYCGNPVEEDDSEIKNEDIKNK